MKTSLLVVLLSCVHKYSDMYENKRESTLNHAFGSGEGWRRQKISRTRNIATEKLSSVFGPTLKRRQGKSLQHPKTLLSTTQKSPEKKWKIYLQQTLTSFSCCCLCHLQLVNQFRRQTSLCTLILYKKNILRGENFTKVSIKVEKWKESEKCVRERQREGREEIKNIFLPETTE